MAEIEIQPMSKKYSVIGYAYGAAATTPGANEAPRTLRGLRLLERLRLMGLDVDDLGDAKGDIDPAEAVAIQAQASGRERQTNHLATTFAACRSLAEKTRISLQTSRIPLIVGGDHSLSIGSVAAVANHYHQQGRDIGLLWIDTHADINTPETSPSHNLFGMSVAFLLGMIPGVMSTLQSPGPAVKPENLVYIGLRDLDPGEKQFIRTMGITAFTTKEVDILGMAEVMRRAIEQVSANTAGYVVSYDLDVCDPLLVPGTGTKVRGGLTFREAHLILELIADDQRMLSFELVELNPLLDREQATAELAVSLFESAVGHSIL